MIPHNRPTLGDVEARAAARVLASGWVAQGPEVTAFEGELAAFLGLAPGAVVVLASGSAALFIALTVLAARGRRVAVPVYSCTALVDAVALADAVPVFIDCAAGSPNLDFDMVAREAPDLVVAPAMFGLPVRLPDTGPPIVLDLAQALGARLDGRPLATHGEIGICSFGATKPITSGGQGGAIFASNPDVVAAVRDHLRYDGPRDGRRHFNFQMTDLQAAIGRVQLARLPTFAARREAIHSIYRDAGLPMLDSADPAAEPLRYRAVMRTSEPLALIAALDRAGIRAIVPIEAEELLDEPDRHPVAATLARTTVSLPIHPSLGDDDARRIAEIASGFG